MLGQPEYGLWVYALLTDHLGSWGGPKLGLVIGLGRVLDTGDAPTQTNDESTYYLKVKQIKQNNG